MKSLEDKMYEIANSIALRSFDSIKIIIIEELESIKGTQGDIHDVMHIILNSLSAIDINVLDLAKRIFEGITGRKIDNEKLINNYIEILSIKVKEFEFHFKKKKMN